MAVLAEAETKLRELVGQAAARGEYDVAVRMATLAKNVAALALDLHERDPDETGPPNAATADPASESPSDSPAPARRGGRRGAPRARRSARTPKRAEYPKFFRDGDYLVKVSWSKKERGEYQHRAPRRVAELLVAAIAKCASNRRLFTSEDVFPLKDPENGGDVPSYQAYAVLAWFKISGLVQPHGRRGYTAENQGQLSELLTSTWGHLQESRA